MPSAGAWDILPLLLHFFLANMFFSIIDSKYYAKLACATTGGLRISSFSDANCKNEVSTNLGLYNDIKVSADYNCCVHIIEIS